MFHLTSIIVIVLTFFGYTPTPGSIAEATPVHTAIQSYEIQLPTSTDATITADGGSTLSRDTVQSTYGPITTFSIIIPNFNKNMPEEPIAPAFEVPLPTEAVPEAPAEKLFIATTLEVENVSKRPLYSGCSSSPTASFLIHVKDQDGNDMHEVGIWYTGTAANNPGGMITSLKGGSSFHYTIKNIEEGPVGVTFYMKPTGSTELVKHFDLTVTKAPTDPSERPAWCD